jgi:hypothetical protein
MLRIVPQELQSSVKEQHVGQTYKAYRLSKDLVVVLRKSCALPIDPFALNFAHFDSI